MACDVLTGKRQAPGGVIYMPAGNLKVFLYLRWQAFLHQFGLKTAYSSHEIAQVVQQIRVELQQRMLT